MSRKEKLIRERFEGITRYQIGDETPLEHPTHWCFSIESVLEALKNQRKHFEDEMGAKIISQRIRREATFELYLGQDIAIS